MTISNDRSPQSSTKEKILYAAFILFAENGFEGTSTRKICEMAEINISAINYYFQSKEGLYNVVVERIAEKFRENLVDYFEEFHTYSSLTIEKAREKLIKFITQLMNIVLFYNLPIHIPLLMSREHIKPGPAYDILYKTVFRDTFQVIYELLKVITQNKLNEEELIFRINSILGAVFGFRVFQTTTMKYLGIDEYNTRQENIIKNLIIDQINYVLDSTGGKV